MNAELQEILCTALNAQYRNILPVGFSVSRVDEYDPTRHTAPNITIEAAENRPARYIVNITSDTMTVPAIGATVNHALQRAIMKAEHVLSGGRTQ